MVDIFKIPINIFGKSSGIRNGWSKIRHNPVFQRIACPGRRCQTLRQREVNDASNQSRFVRIHGGWHDLLVWDSVMPVLVDSYVQSLTEQCAEAS
jgi:hypothetical protein